MNFFTTFRLGFGPFSNANLNAFLCGAFKIVLGLFGIFFERSLWLLLKFGRWSTEKSKSVKGGRCKNRWTGSDNKCDFLIILAKSSVFFLGRDPFPYFQTFLFSDPQNVPNFFRNFLLRCRPRYGPSPSVWPSSSPSNRCLLRTYSRKRRAEVPPPPMSLLLLHASKWTMDGGLHQILETQVRNCISQKL